MKCTKCGKVMEPAFVEFENDVRGTSVKVTVEGFKCPACTFSAIDMNRMGDYGRAVADAYREREGLLTSGQIRASRERLRMSQEDFADYLGVGIASVKRWEAGQIQERSMDKLLRLMTDPDAAAAHAHSLRARTNEWRLEPAWAELAACFSGEWRTPASGMLECWLSTVLVRELGQGRTTWRTPATSSVQWYRSGARVMGVQTASTIVA